ncbi:sugar phosphate isomerase/epimerase family protein [Gluconobacter morbifer]|uniref:Putative 4-hydroxyphenylpyruvate dioxygenase n=1 Tax=Gluconobacter morbifer G707 TaxID=1088869 RepID=G6XLW6_9PROT|nr:sugar phosphate isomerase/epimerase family protein [Gluconobacter morbifer]EHH67371.1 putative 4-hydroxyphenylpyruvate dioxygenase [Gluconobacter morbifer G707]
MSDFPFLFGVNEFTTQPWSFEEDIHRYRELGVQAVEICEVKLDPARLDQQMRLAQESGMVISAIQPSVRTFFGSAMAPDPEEPAARFRRFEQSLRTLAPYAPGTVFVTNTGAPPHGNIRRTMDETVQALRKLCPIAVELGVSLSLEPLNPTSMNTESAIWTIDQAMDIIDGVGHPAVGLCLDFWNIWQQDDVCAAIRRAGEKINVLQVSDWRTPYSPTDRLIPGDGDIPLHDMLRATADAGFRGSCTVEIFSSNVPDSLYDRDLKTVITECRDGLDKAWRTA